MMSNGNGLTPEQLFFLSPEKPLHRQYEALRAYFVEQLPSDVAAERFGYSPGGFRVLCHQFRHELKRQERFFKDVEHGPHAAPKRDPIRETVISLRKQNLSVYDIQRELAERGTEISAPTIIMMGVKPENIRIVINRFSPKLHPANKIEASFNSGFKKTCAALPKIGAVIPDNWDASVKETYDGEIALDGTSQWHNIAKEIADLAGYRYKPTGSNGPSRDGSSFFARLLKKGDR